jgi:hypothetical protein
MFAYMNPMMSGSHREFSSPFDDFWCCVGTGMESHAKHGDSIYWRAGAELLVNLYIPSTLDWAEKGMRLELTTLYPFEDEIRIKILERRSRGPLTVGLRIPGWCRDAAAAINGEATAAGRSGGYLRLRKPWASGDMITLTLKRALRTEATVDDARTLALLYGPLVLAGDLGPAGENWDGPAPVLVGADIVAAVSPVAGEPASFRTVGLGRPADLTLRPYTFLHERSTAVYFRHFTDDEWRVEQAGYQLEQARLAALQARSADVMHLGEMQAERDHALAARISYPVVYRGRHGRDARSGGYFEFTLKTRAGPLVLEATYWGEERNRRFAILVDGVVLAREDLQGDRPGEFFDRNYPIPPALTAGKSAVRVRFEPETGVTAGPVFLVRLTSQVPGGDQAAAP